MKRAKFLALSLALLAGCTPKPPQGAFPGQIGSFHRVGDPVAVESSLGVGGGKYFSTTYYGPDGNTERMYMLYTFSSHDEARKGLQAAKQKLQHDYPDKYQFLQETGDRFVAVWKESGSTTIYVVAGDKMIEVSGGLPAEAADFESRLPYEAYGVSKPAPPPVAEPTLDYKPFLALLDDFNKSGDKDDAAKYNDKWQLLSGTVAAAGQTSDGDPYVGFLKPGATKYDGREGTTAIFKKGEAAKVKALQKGQEIKFGCRLQVALGVFIAKDCALH